MSELVSIILPVKNALPFLDECLESIKSQTYAQFECLMINDSCTDKSVQLMSVFSFFDSRFKLIANEGTGLIEAYKTGLRHSTGSLITRMDADDIMHEQRLELMVNQMRNSPLKRLVTGMVEFFPRETLGPGTLFYERWLNDRMKLRDFNAWKWRECVIPSPCWMARKSELVKHEMFEDLDYPEDYELMFRFFHCDFIISPIPEVIHYWRQHPGRYSKTSEHYSAARFMKKKLKWFTKTEIHLFDNIGILGTGLKAKLLVELLELENIPFNWFTHEKNISVNRWKGHEIQLIKPKNLSASTGIISTLSSIDQFQHVYDYLDTSGVIIYKFC